MHATWLFVFRTSSMLISAQKKIRFQSLPLDCTTPLVFTMSSWRNHEARAATGAHPFEAPTPLDCVDCLLRDRSVGDHLGSDHSRRSSQVRRSASWTAQVRRQQLECEGQQSHRGVPRGFVPNGTGTWTVTGVSNFVGSTQNGRSLPEPHTAHGFFSEDGGCATHVCPYEHCASRISATKTLQRRMLVRLLLADHPQWNAAHIHAACQTRVLNALGHCIRRCQAAHFK